MMLTTDSRPQTGILMNLVVARLAPMFLSITAGDIDLASATARETIDDYRARNQADLLTIAQIIACGLASLCSLGRSFGEDLPLSMLLRLRANGIALSRAAEQTRRALDARGRNDPAHPAPPPEPDPPITEYDDQPESELSAAAEQILAAESTASLQSPDEAPVRALSSVGDDTTSEKRHRQKWGIALTYEAEELLASIPNLPSAEQATAALRAGMMTRTANELLGVPMTAPPTRRDQTPFP